jgi:glycosyltransferase involved in cell wall biosynthesis
MAEPANFKILHILRAPIGGLFRHVVDLGRGQAERGHQVGVVAAEAEPGSVADTQLRALASQLPLGVMRIPMRRQLGLGDAAAVSHVSKVIAAAGPGVVHGHGAKGGAYARLARSTAIRVYTPHGGSLHYGRWTPQGVVYRVAERILMRRTDLFLFESQFARDTYQAAIGTPRVPVHVVPNGVGAAEFQPIGSTGAKTDIVMVGELRYIKGIDVLIEAIAELVARGRIVAATIVGDGPDAASLRHLAAERGLSNSLRFAGYQPARHAFSLGRLLVVPSRAESLPYIVLEAAAAGVPMVATRVGGIPEVFGASTSLVPPGNATALAEAVIAALDDMAAAQTAANRLRERVRALYSQDGMVEGVLTAYREAIEVKFHRSH